MLLTSLPTLKLLPNVFPGYDGEGGEGGGAAAGAEGNSLPGEPGTLTMETVMAEVNKTVNNAVANLRKSDLPKIVEQGLAPVNTKLTQMTEALGKLTPPPAPPPGSSPEVNAQLKQLQDMVKNQGDTISKLQKDKDDSDKRAERAERTSVLRSALTGIGQPFANDKALDTAFVIVEPLVQRQEDGSLVAGELPLKDFVKDFLPKEHPYLFKASGSSGSGAGTGNGRQQQKADMSMIRPGMTAEQRELVLAGINEAMKQ